MKFPRPAKSPFVTQNCRTPMLGLKASLIRRIGTVGEKRKLPKPTPERAAALLYLGLCHLRQMDEEETQINARAEMQQAHAAFEPEKSGSTVNCSYYASWQVSLDGQSIIYPDHRRIIDVAMGAFYPEIRAIRKKCFLLLELGTRHGGTVKVPDDETWVETYEFKDFDLE